ncbi:MAG: hypothetical protein HQM00_14395 [Magnetococcales bacterium]|nr:hypothetical protein [Magnetococcales bacterium]
MDQAVIELLGCDFDQYLDTFYLAQSRHGRPGKTLEALAGIPALTRIDASLNADLENARHAIATHQGRQTELRHDLTTLNIREENLNRLENQFRQADSAVATAQATIERWSGVENGLIQAHRRIETACDQLGAQDPAPTLQTWQDRSRQLDLALQELETLGGSGHWNGTEAPAALLRAWHARWMNRLHALETNLSRIDEERNRLLCWLGAPPAEAAHPDTLAQERTDLQQTIHRARRRHAKRNRRIPLYLLLSLIGWFSTLVVWQERLQEHYPPILLDVLKDQLPFLHRGPNLLLVMASGWFSLMLLWNLIGRWSAGRRIRRAEAGNLALDQVVTATWNTIDAIPDAARLPLNAQIERLLALDPQPWSEELRRWSREEGRPFLDSDALAAELNQLAEARNVLRGALEPLQEHLRVCGQTARQQQIQKQDQARVSVDALNRELDRRLERTRFQGLLAELDQAINRDYHAIEVAQLARELLQGAGQEAIDQFRAELQRVFAQLVPRFTDGRYHTPHLDNALNVDIFSEAKQDRIPMAELSTGVRRQLALAMRIALCQAVTARVSGDHFLALDEPFAYSDRERSRKTLEILHSLGDRITQLWITAPEFAADQLSASRHVACTLEHDS